MQLVPPPPHPSRLVVSLSCTSPDSATPNLPMSCSVVTESILSVPCSTLASAGAHADASSRTSADARGPRRGVASNGRTRARHRAAVGMRSVATGGPSRRARARLQNRGSNPVGGEGGPRPVLCRRACSDRCDLAINPSIRFLQVRSRAGKPRHKISRSRLERAPPVERARLTICENRPRDSRFACHFCIDGEHHRFARHHFEAPARLGTGQPSSRKTPFSREERCLPRPRADRSPRAPRRSARRACPRSARRRAERWVVPSSIASPRRARPRSLRLLSATRVQEVAEPEGGKGLLARRCWRADSERAGRRPRTRGSRACQRTRRDDGEKLPATADRGRRRRRRKGRVSSVQKRHVEGAGSG